MGYGVLKKWSLLSKKQSKKVLKKKNILSKIVWVMECQSILVKTESPVGNVILVLWKYMWVKKCCGNMYCVV